MRFLIVGKGGREHALAWKLASSVAIDELFLWPANVLSREYGRPLDLAPTASLDELVRMCQQYEINAVIVGPERHLADGLADKLANVGIACFGPKQTAAKLESSKAFAKQIMVDAGVPTANFELAHSQSECLSKARAMLESKGAVVIKADGLADGKGVFVCKTASQVEESIERLYSTMSQAATTVVLEEQLIGRECSYFTFIGKGGATELGFAVDFKRLSDGDHGPNTGGMGGYSPVPWLAKKAGLKIQETVIEPLLATLAAKNIEYCGCLYVGLMWTATGPKVIEFNVRLGDPEAQILTVCDNRDWGILLASKLGIRTAHHVDPHFEVFDSHSTVAVVVASSNYPFYETKEEHVELPYFAVTENTPHSVVFGAAVESPSRGELFTGRGRVLTVVGRAHDLEQARSHAYDRVQQITKNWPQAKWRTDIGLRVTVEEIPYGGN